MVLVILNLAKYIEQENAHIFVQIFVVEKELRQKGQIFTVNWILVTIDLENCYTVFFITIDLISWGMEKWANLWVSFELDFEGEETQTEITNV